MRGKLRLVASEGGLSAETLTEVAMQPLPANTPAAAIEARAHSLALDVVAVIRREEEPAILASVAMVIPDQPMKVAFLEAIGSYLMAIKLSLMAGSVAHVLLTSQPVI